MTGGSEAADENGRQSLRGIGIEVCVPPLQVEVKPAEDECRKTAYA